MDIVLRVAIIYVCLMVGLRIIGKREFAELSALELVALLMIPELVSSALQGEGSIVNGLIGVATLFILVFLTSAIMYLSKKAEILISGQPVVLIQHGQFIKDHLHKERVSADEIFNAMHLSGLERLNQVKWAILESDGKIAIVPEEASEQGDGGGENEQPTGLKGG